MSRFDSNGSNFTFYLNYLYLVSLVLTGRVHWWFERSEYDDMIL